MNNFDFLRDEPRFAAFAGVAISAERIILIDPQLPQGYGVCNKMDLFS